MLRNFCRLIESIFNTILLYSTVFLSLISPGTIIWKLFRNRKGKVRLYNRDLICDGQTLMSLEKSSKPLDQFTNALSPFVPLFLIDNDNQWKQRRDLFAYGNNQINQRLTKFEFNIELQSGKSNLLWIIFDKVSKLSFELVFNRKATIEEFEDISLGLIDINKILKRFSSTPNLIDRQRFYDRILKLIVDHDEPGFIFNGYQRFDQMKEIDKVSSVAEDFLTTISVQCTDLLCHLLILYQNHSDEFHSNFENCFNETLRLYPLTDLWVRQQSGSERNWIASLVQLNRNGWNSADQFLPSRWNQQDNPTLFSWGFDSRRCPAQKFATRFVQIIFEKLINNQQFWIRLAKNFEHERTFPYGCPVWIGYGQIPIEANHWTFKNKIQIKIRRWIFEKIRMFDQKELN